MTGDFIDARRAERIGLYHRVVADGEVLREARTLAEKLARGPQAALAVTKDMLNREAAMPLESALAAEGRVQAALMQGPDFQEAFDAFRAKREARFR
jgi:2-(1,2-epoxy-1,2-dihydrophenyl)acetyl-CoA isomerase